MYTLVLITEDNRILLGMKKRGFGVGKWNGFGGKVEHNECIEAAAHRELMEECSLACDQLRKVGVLLFQLNTNTELMEVHVFRADEYQGVPTESDEMRPRWFDIDNLPLDKMWDDDRIWLPLFLDNKSFSGHFLLNDGGFVLKHQVNIIDDDGEPIEPFFAHL